MTPINRNKANWNRTAIPLDISAVGGLPLVSRSQQALHNQLIGSMAGQGKESPADQSRPERVGPPEVGGEVEDPQLACVLRQIMNRRPASGNEMQNREQTHQRSADVNRGLHHIRPYHRRQPALEGVDQRECCDDCDGGDLARAKCDGYHDRNRVNPHPLSRSPRHQEKAGSQRAQLLAEAAFNQLVRGVEIATEIMGQKDKTDNHTAHDISHYHLQKREIGIVSQTWNADDGQRAGFRRDDRKRNRPPGNIPVGEKVVAQSALLLPEAQSEQSDPSQIERDNGEIELVQNHNDRVARAPRPLPARASADALGESCPRRCMPSQSSGLCRPRSADLPAGYLPRQAHLSKTAMTRWYFGAG